MSKPMQYLAADHLYDLVDGCYEQKIESVQTQLREHGCTPVATFPDRVIAVTEAGLLLEFGVTGGRLTGKGVALTSPVVTEGSEGYWQATIALLVDSFFESFSPRGAPTLSAYIEAHLEQPRTWRTLFIEHQKVILHFLSISPNTPTQGGKKHDSFVISEGKGEKELSCNDKNPVKSWKDLCEKVDELAISVKKSLQQFPVGILSKAGEPGLEMCLGTFAEDLLLDLSSLSKMLSMLPEQQSQLVGSQDETEIRRKFLSLYEGGTQFVTAIVGRLSTAQSPLVGLHDETTYLGRT